MNRLQLLQRRLPATDALQGEGNHCSPAGLSSVSLASQQDRQQNAKMGPEAKKFTVWVQPSLVTFACLAWKVILRFIPDKEGNFETGGGGDEKKVKEQREKGMHPENGWRKPAGS